MRWLYAFLLIACTAACAQESQLGADFRGEGERFHASCAKFSLKSSMGCAQLLFTDHPLHIAAGSLPPQNGFGAGAAFVTHWTPNESLRMSLNADAVASSNTSWRTGGYLKLIFTPAEHITAAASPSGTPKHSNLGVHPYTVFNIYAQSISLNKLYYYGIGPNTPKTAQSVFGMQQTITGANVILPIVPKLSLSLLGEINGRAVSIRGNHSESAPSIEKVYTEATAPGLTSQPTTLQLGEGVRFKPTLFNDHWQIDYLANFQQYMGSHSTFHRFIEDFSWTFPIYRNSRSYGPKDVNGPDECAVDVGARCPSLTTNRFGSIGLRIVEIQSINSSRNAVPFYFQPTLGGSDINGNTWLGSYEDYRFRAPNALLLRESVEHSIWGPLGLLLSTDQGKVAFRRSDIAFNHLAHSFSVGATLRAAGLPVVSLSYCWGGKEGSHTIATVNNSLLGGSSRPSLF